jgi:hypothetical protein
VRIFTLFPVFLPPSKLTSSLHTSSSLPTYFLDDSFLFCVIQPLSGSFPHFLPSLPLLEPFRTSQNLWTPLVPDRNMWLFDYQLYRSTIFHFITIRSSRDQCIFTRDCFRYFVSLMFLDLLLPLPMSYVCSWSYLGIFLVLPPSSSQMLVLGYLRILCSSCSLCFPVSVYPFSSPPSSIKTVLWYLGNMNNSPVHTFVPRPLSSVLSLCLPLRIGFPCPYFDSPLP